MVHVLLSVLSTNIGFSPGRDGGDERTDVVGDITLCMMLPSTISPPVFSREHRNCR